MPAPMHHASRRATCGTIHDGQFYQVDNDVTTDWLVPVLTLITGALGGYLGASAKIIVLEVKVEELLKWKEKAHTSLHAYNEDILIHDIELQAIMGKTGIPRAKRQRYREEDS
jgi:hypothetical protein